MIVCGHLIVRRHLRMSVCGHLIVRRHLRMIIYRILRNPALFKGRSSGRSHDGAFIVICSRVIAVNCLDDPGSGVKLFLQGFHAADPLGFPHSESLHQNLFLCGSDDGSAF